MSTFSGQAISHRIIPLLEKLSAHMDAADEFRACMDSDACSDLLHDWLERTQFSAFTNQNIPIALRAKFSREMGLLGLDTRAGVGLDENGLPDIVWCDVPAGDFLYGSDKRRDPYAYRTELPQRTISIAQPYRMARFPITEVQFSAFAQSSDYADTKWWRDVPAEYQAQPIFIIEEDSQPAPNDPATHISWYQATAFCNWLTAKVQQANIITENQVIRLPTEYEWEKAARGTDGRVYPYGDDAEIDNANMSDANLGTVCAVGLFPDGISPYSIHDMSGNVFEWCAPSEDATYSLRGGSFFMSQEWARCAYRYERTPSQQLKDFGFRIVLSASNLPPN